MTSSTNPPKKCGEFVGRSDQSRLSADHTNEEWLTRDQLAEVFKNLALRSPTRVGPLETSKRSVTKSRCVAKRPGYPRARLGGEANRQGFRTMPIDLFTVKNGKLASACHVENWITALQLIGE
jgi:hypothetical protein